MTAIPWQDGWTTRPAKKSSFPPKRHRRTVTVAVRRGDDVWTASSTPSWVNDIVDRIKAIGELGPGWDGAGGLPVSDAALQMALGVLSETMSSDSVAPEVVPTSDGGLQLEWHFAGVDLEVYVEPDGRISVWCREGSREWEEDYYPRAKLSKELSLLTRAFVEDD